MNLSQRATSNISLLAFVAALAALAISLYSLWLEPQRVRLRLLEIEATNELTRNLVQLSEWMQAERERLEARQKEKQWTP